MVNGGAGQSKGIEKPGKFKNNGGEMVSNCLFDRLKRTFRRNTYVVWQSIFRSKSGLKCSLGHHGLVALNAGIQASNSSLALMINLQEFPETSWGWVAASA